MGVIKKVLYERVSSDICDAKDASEFFFYSNMMALTDIYDDKYFKHEINQSNARNKILSRLPEEEINNTVVHTADIIIGMMSEHVFITGDIRN